MIKLRGATWPKDIFSNFTIQKLSNTAGHKAQEFVKRLHYTGTLARGCNNTFVLWSEGKIYGVAMFGHPTSRKAQMYASGQGSVVECKRFVLARKAPKNVASWFLAKCLNELKRDKRISTILSYADPEAGHEGTFYKAANFTQLESPTKQTQMLKLRSGELVHQRVAYQKIGGVYTKTAKRVQELLHSGKAKQIYLAPKLLFKYDLKK